MPPVSVEDAFMATLLADLDANAFASSPPSSCAPTPRKPTPRPQKHSTTSARCTATPKKARLAPPAAARPPDAASDGPSPRQNKPRFWDDPLAFPALTPRTIAARDKQELAARAAAAGPPPSRKAVGGVLSPKPNRGVKRALGAAEEGAKTPRRVRHVEVEVEGKENALNGGKGALFRPRADKGKGKEVVREEVVPVKSEETEEADEFGELAMEGVDWDAALLGFDDEAAAAAKQSKDPPRSKQYTRCVVEEVVDGVGSSSKRQKVLAVSGSNFEGLRQVVLCDDWVDTPVESGDIVNLIGAFDPLLTSSPSLTLTRSDGLLILHPDILVSSTKVADSSHCTRKAVLQEIIRTLGGSNPSVAYGNMLHALMQSCLADGRWDEEFRHARIDEIVKENGGQLWTMELSFEKARDELRERSKEFEAFADRFVGDKPEADAFLSDPRAADSARSRLALTSTLGVEEDIWSPRYGLKGKIDVSTSSTVVDWVGFTRKGTTPFEIKTGRSIAGMEHRAQTMLYTLLMSDRYDQDVDSGLLYYTKTNEIFRVQAARNELRGLILARNRFATFLHRRMTLTPSGAPAATQSTVLPSQLAADGEVEKEESEDEDDEDALWADMGTPRPSASQAGEVALLPPPIDDERSCKKCYVNDACMLFRRTVEGDLDLCADSGDPLQVIYADKTGHLTDAQAEFFRHWEKLVSYEEQELVRYKREIWTMQAEEREKVGRCFANMVIAAKEEEDAGANPSIHRFTYRLRRQPGSSTSSQDAPVPLIGGSISVNDPVVISLEDPSVLAISRGFVLSLSPHEVVLGLDQSLTSIPQVKRTANPSSLVFRVDKDELAAGMGRIRDNLLQLFVAGGNERRRRLVVDLEAPSFDAALASAGDRLIPPNLNGDQRLALEKVLAAQNYALILGMPGTGKTTTLAEVLKVLARAGKSVLLTSYTHSAVDNILLKLKDAGLSILRLGNRDKIMPALHPYTLTPDDYAVSHIDIDNKLMTPQIVATTCLGINEPIFTKRRFDYCIVDEASQVTLPTCLGPLRFADKFILVGDHNQLPPLVRNHAARKGGLDVSLFKRLSDAHPAAVVNLTHQYRMNSDIMRLSNELVYRGELKVGDVSVGGRRLVLPREEKREGLDEWEKEVVDPSRTVIFVDTDALPARETRHGSLIENELEALLVKQTVAALTTCGVPEHDIGVITPYRQQIKLLHRTLGAWPDVEVLTADRSQGRDKEVVVVSFVRSNKAGNVGDLLRDWRRLNVCLTRAKAKLVLFGSRSTLQHVPMLAQLMGIVDEEGWGLKLREEVGERVRALQAQEGGKGEEVKAEGVEGAVKDAVKEEESVVKMEVEEEQKPSL
ncbi:hypothetical protein JCM10207_001295 [Rhodosporidiobolus poonsookiae]